jgi:hypothetical protein
VRVTSTAGDSGRRGELIADVTVPDFGRDALSVTGFVVTETPAPQSIRASELTGVIAGIPTTSRTFSRQSAVGVAIRMYQSPMLPRLPVRVRATIIDERDRTVHTANSAIDGLVFEEKGFGEYRLALPTVSLTPGAYLLRLDLTRETSKTAVRDLRFRIE